jgi:hypothetical protein
MEVDIVVRGEVCQSAGVSYSDTRAAVLGFELLQNCVIVLVDSVDQQNSFAVDGRARANAEAIRHLVEIGLKRKEPKAALGAAISVVVESLSCQSAERG